MRFTGFSMEKQSNPKSILIVKLSAIGDVVHTLPLLEVLRKGFPRARIDWLVEEEAKGIIEGHPAIDRILVSQRKFWQKRLFREGGPVVREVVAFLQTLRKEKYDLVIDMQGLIKSGLLIGLSRAKRKIGFTWAREGSTLFLSEPPHPVDQHHQHAIERYLKTAEILGCGANSWQGRIPVRLSDSEAVDRLLCENNLEGERLVAVNPMAGWETKLWEPEKFAPLAERIERAFSCKIVFTGGPKDRDAVAAIIAQMKGRHLDLSGRISLKELACLYSRCTLLISTDTGPMHIAAAMGCPVVALFGPTAPWRTGPYGKGHRVIREDIACSPCFKKKCDHMTCMKGITVERVFDAVQELLQWG